MADIWDPESNAAVWGMLEAAAYRAEADERSGEMIIR